MELDLNYLWMSLNGFYKASFDVCLPEEVYKFYIIRKAQLIETKTPTTEKNIKRLNNDKLLLDFANKNPNLLIGFFKDKQQKRDIFY